MDRTIQERLAQIQQQSAELKTRSADLQSWARAIEIETNGLIERTKAFVEGDRR